MGRCATLPSQCGAMAERRTRDRQVPGSKLACAIWFLLLPTTAVQAVVGSIVWAFRRPNKQRCREMSARGYALYCECPPTFFSYNGS